MDIGHKYDRSLLDVENLILFSGLFKVYSSKIILVCLATSANLFLINPKKFLNHNLSAYLVLHLGA
jgi:hypothetical protein